MNRSHRRLQTVQLALAGAVAGALLLADGATGNILVDGFSTSQSATVSGGGSTATSVAAAAEAIGGERDLTVERIAGVGAAVAAINEAEMGLLGVSVDAATEATFEVLWDGPDGTADTIDFDGLGGVDLTENAALDSFEITACSDLATMLDLRIYDASDATGNKWSMGTLLLPAEGCDTLEAFVLPFDSFLATGPAGAASFSNVGAIALLLSGPSSFDALVDVIQVVPEPSAGGLAALVALGACRRWRTRQTG